MLYIVCLQPRVQETIQQLPAAQSLTMFAVCTGPGKLKGIKQGKESSIGKDYCTEMGERSQST